MKDTFFNHDEHLIISKKQVENFEDLIGTINAQLEDNFNVRICYDKNDEFMNYPKTKSEEAFSGFAILNQSETIYPEVKTSMDKIIIIDDKGEEHQFTNIKDLVAYANSFSMSWLPDGFSWELFPKNKEANNETSN